MMKKWFVWSMVIGLVVLGVVGVTYGKGMKDSWDGPPNLPDPATIKADFQQGLNQLVDNRVIDSKQANMVLQYFDQAMDELKGIAPGEVGVKIRQLGEEGRDPLSRLVKDGILNKDQAEAVASLLPHPPVNFAMNNMDRFGPPMNPAMLEKMVKDKFEHDLNVLVQADFITMKQAETVTNYLGQVTQGLKESKSGPDNTWSVPFMEGHDNPLSKLVKDGVITEKQARVIALIIPVPPMGPPIPQRF
jgi:hypothetical protein